MVLSSQELDALRSINSEKAELLAPVIAYTVVLMILGTLGNPIAIYIYGFKWQNTTTRVFLLCLAVLDLINCVITMPTEISLMADFYYFPNGNFCLVSRFITYFINNATSAVFLFIATDRYFRICRPHGWKFSVTSAKTACAVSLCIGAMVSWPAIVIYGNKTVVFPMAKDNATGEGVFNVTGVMCNVKNRYENTVGSDLFFNYLWCGFIICVSILSVFYILIGRAILRRRRKVRKMHALAAESQIKDNGVVTEHLQTGHTTVLYKCNNCNKQTTSSYKATNSFNNSSQKENHEHIQLTSTAATGINSNNSAKPIDQSVPENVSSNPYPELCDCKSVELGETVENNRKSLKLKADNVIQEREPDSELQKMINNLTIETRATPQSPEPVGCGMPYSWRTRVPRSTLMLFAITAVFILTFLPFLIIISIRQRMGPGFYPSLSATEEVLVHIFSRSYLVNNCANPIVYGLVNEQFRTEVKRLFKAPTASCKSS